jgi:hypothetical protein
MNALKRALWNAERVALIALARLALTCVEAQLNKPSNWRDARLACRLEDLRLKLQNGLTTLQTTPW